MKNQICVTKCFSDTIGMVPVMEVINFHTRNATETAVTGCLIIRLSISRVMKILKTIIRRIPAGKSSVGMKRSAGGFSVMNLNWTERGVRNSVASRKVWMEVIAIHPSRNNRGNQKRKGYPDA